MHTGDAITEQVPGQIDRLGLPNSDADKAFIFAVGPFLYPELAERARMAWKLGLKRLQELEADAGGTVTLIPDE
jgi:hypothetical protein